MTTAPEGWPSDFMEQMWLTVAEESSPWEVLLGVNDYVHGEIIEHGPWDPTECSTLLVRWFDAGLIELYSDKELPPDWRGTPKQWKEVCSPGWNPPLDGTEARDLMADPAPWTQESEDGFVLLSPSEEGQRANLEVWVERGKGTR